MYLNSQVMSDRLILRSIDRRKILRQLHIAIYGVDVVLGYRIS